MKKISIAMMLLFVLTLSGCGASSTVKIVTEEHTYPEPDEVVANLEGAGYTVEHGGSIDGLEAEPDRIQAVNGEHYIDICYNVTSVADMDTIIEYYMDCYAKYNLVSDTDIVYCYSDDSAAESAGLQ